MAALPDHLLAAVLAHACSTAVVQDQLAAAAVRNCAQIALVCRRFRALLREHAPALSLDFTSAPLTPAQISWLAAKTPTYCAVGAVYFHEFEEEFWEGPHHLFLANHLHTLQRLGGLSYSVVTVDQDGWQSDEVLDLSGSNMRTLSIRRWCCSAWLVAARLPARLETLEFTCHNWFGETCPAWSGAPGDDPPGCLAKSERTVRCQGEHVKRQVACIPAGLSRPGASSLYQSASMAR